MKVVDLTLTIKEDMPCFPVEWYPKPKFENILHVDNDPTGSHRYASKALLFNHGGTHLDAPKHYNYHPCEKTIDKVPVNILVNKTVWLHLPEKKSLGPITASDLQKAAAGYELKGRGLLITTGYTDRNWGSAEYFFDSPYLSIDAAEWIVAQKITMVSIDFQTDKPKDATFPVHNKLLSNEVYILEYITNVEALLASGIARELVLSVGALKLEGCEASSARVFAIES